MIIIKEKNRKIKNYQHQISNIESKYKILNQSNISEVKDFFKKFNQYKYTFNLLFSCSDYYFNIKDIELSNKNISQNIYLMMENIWNSEYYDFIMNIRSIEPLIQLLVKDSYKYGFITKIQLELIKLIRPKIINMFESDIILKSIYEYKTNIILPSREEIDLYFNIIEIIIFKLFESNKKKNNSYTSNIENIILDKNYTDTIAKIKNIKKNNIIKYL